MNQPQSAYGRRILAISMVFPALGTLIGLAGGLGWMSIYSLIPAMVILDLGLIWWLLLHRNTAADRDASPSP